jgi:hypothetical protein
VAQKTRACGKPTLTSFVVLHGFLLKIFKYIQPKLLFQAITIVSEKALQTISVGGQVSELGHSAYTCKTGNMPA